MTHCSVTAAYRQVGGLLPQPGARARTASGLGPQEKETSQGLPRLAESEQVGLWHLYGHKPRGRSSE